MDEGSLFIVGGVAIYAETILDLDQPLSRRTNLPGYTFSLHSIIFFTLFTFPEKVARIDWGERPNHRELAFLLGLMVQRSYFEGRISQVRLLSGRL